MKIKKGPRESRRQQHIKIMSGAMIWDLLLILQIEFTRGAIDTASKGTDNPTALLFHLFFAISTVFFYIGMIYTGCKILKHQTQFRNLHKKLGVTTLIFRILTFVTSFFAVAPELP